MNATAVGGRIRQKRESLGLTRRALAKLAGVHPNSIYVYERGRIPDPGQLVDLARALQVAVPWLLTGEAKDLSGGGEERKRRLKEEALFSMTPAGQATVWQEVSIPGDLERDGRLIKGIKDLIDVLRGFDRKEAELVLGNLGSFATLAKSRSRKKGPMGR